MDKMQIEPFNFRNFESGVAAVQAVPKPFLPGGKRRREGPPLPPPIFNEDQLKAAERESYKKGFIEGTKEGRKLQDNEQAANDRNLVEGLDNLLKSIAPLFADYRATILQAKDAMPKAALSIAHKVAASALNEKAQAVVEETVVKCIELMLGEPKLVITVHASLVEPMKQKVAQVLTRNQVANDIIVNGDAALPQTDCRVEWKHGSLTRDTGKLWQEITRVVEGMSASARHDTEMHMKTLEAKLPTDNEPTNGKKE